MITAGRPRRFLPAVHVPTPLCGCVSAAAVV